MDQGFAQIRLAPLLRVEAMYLLGDTSIGFVICAKEGMTVRRPGLHAVERGELAIHSTTSNTKDVSADRA